MLPDSAKSESWPPAAGKAARLVLVLVAAIALAACAVVAFLSGGPGPMQFAGGSHVALAAYHDTDPTGVPQELKSAAEAKRGEYLARAAGCQACHTAPDGTPFIGGRAFASRFGTLFSTNITPDPETGIGRYTDAEFLAALRRGVARDGKRLYPAMPYTSYTYMPDADALAIKAYLSSLTPVKAATPPARLSFPFNHRALMALWAGLFNPDRRFEPSPDRSAEWNRGAYLAEAMQHCGECHTPRNALFALDNKRKYAGANQAGWRAYNITADRTGGIGGWSDEEVAGYLRSGHAPGRGIAAGPMAEEVEDGTRYLTESDRRAMVAYLRSVPAIAEVGSVPVGAGAPADPRAELVYAGACAGCHGRPGGGGAPALAPLAGVRSVNDRSGLNVVQVIIRGTSRALTAPGTNMPAFGDTYTDAEVVSLANYVRARFGAGAGPH